MGLRTHERDALEVIRRFSSITESERDPGHPREIVIKAMLIMFQEDDDEPITRDWLDAAFPERNSARWYLDDTLRLVLQCCEQGGGDYAIYIRCDDCDVSNWLRSVDTRGEVRAFLRGMGLDTKGGN